MKGDLAGFFDIIDWGVLLYGGTLFVAIFSIGIFCVLLFTGIKLQSNRRDKLVEHRAQSLVEEALRKIEHRANGIARSTAEQVSESIAAKVARREANLITVAALTKLLGKDMPRVPSDEVDEKLEKPRSGLNNNGKW